MKKTIELFQRIWKKSFTPIPKTSVSEWADKYRILSSESAAEPGRWRTDRAPYQREIMNSFTQPGIHKVVAKTASQIGKSDIMNNVMGRFAHLDPGPMMMIQPTIDLSEDYSKSRIAPMIRDTKVLNTLFSDVKSRDSNNTILSKLFPGGRLIMCGANSPAGLASRPIRILLGDEVDRFPDSAGTEGDPVDLAFKRLTTFWNWVAGLFSTPTIKGSSRIDVEYAAGTQEEWQHECPNCHESHLITHRNMKYEFDETKNDDGTKFVIVHSVLWCCPDCGQLFDEQTMKAAPQNYVAKNPAAIKNGVRSFFVNCFASPWLKWKDMIREYLEAKGDPEREKVVYNTRFGESYERKGNYEDEIVFLNRREEYPAALPDGVLLLTAAVDTQDNRLEYEIAGWGEGEENWGIKKGIVLGVPDRQETWDELDQQLDRAYRLVNGTGLMVARTFIDSGGHYTEQVYKYCRTNMHKGRFAIKGMPGAGIPLIYRVGVAKGYGIPLVLVGVDGGKQYIMDRLSIDTPGPKYMHFPMDNQQAELLQGAIRKTGINIPEVLFMRGYDQIYFKGLIAEKLVPRKVKGKIIMQWENVATDKRNEPLDLKVYNLACLHSINPNWDMYRKLINGPKVEGEKLPEQKTEKKNPAAQYGCIKKGLR
ncbi:phage terminase large subunit family protein [Anaerospora hongkongensis]|uniref:phage terminase large subunit family protein n=1 Tax=Anaerospora hongkongensis TaxID=244830 RepID=UPI002FDA2D7A